MKKNRLLARFLAVLMFTMSGCGGNGASSAEPPAESLAPAETSQLEASASSVASAEDETAYDEVFAVVHTNDVHGFISVEPYVKAVADSLKEEYGQGNVVTVSAGDVYAGGNAVAHLYKGELIPPIMDAAGYDLLVPGNNDFNFGGDTLVSLGQSASHLRMICANLYAYQEDETQGETIFDRSAVFTTEGGTKVGFFGLTVSGGSVSDMFFNPGSVDTAQELVRNLEGENCGVIIGIGHTGWNDDLVTPSANDTTSAALVKEVPGIDGYVDGHSHSIIQDGEGWVCPETGTLVNQASCKGDSIGVMTFYLKDGKVVNKTAELITGKDLESYTPDAATQKLVDEAFARLEEDTGDAYTTSEYFLNALRTSESTDGRSVRTDETNLGDLITDALRSIGGADVGMMPGFRIRASIAEGPITAVSLYDVFANGADIYVMEKTGQELLELMARSLIDLPNESTQFNQISGASYGYVIGGDHQFTIVDPMVDGEPLDVDKTYLVAMDAGGPDAPEDQEPVLSGMEAVAEAVGEYMATPECTILPDEPTPDHRIVPMAEKDIPKDAVTYEITAEMAPPPDAPPA